jgi:hypothetical protein
MSRRPVLFQEARKSYHAALLNTGVLCISKKNVPSNADSSSRTSVALARGIIERLGSNVAGRLAGQVSGSQFEQITKSFIEQTFLRLKHLRPGDWDFSPQKRLIARFEQYAHLAELSVLSQRNYKLAAVLGTDYVIAPDIVVVRNTESDESINRAELLVDDAVSRRASLRAKSGGLPLLHASISCKWTLRSDRAQNARSEALNLIRNRKGRLPHVMVVTGEPLPSRLASIALGTGDIDCVYHFALGELIESVKAIDLEDSKEMMDIMVEGKRLKDIADLPLDLAV